MPEGGYLAEYRGLVFLEGMCPDDQREKEGVVGFQMLDIVQPFAGEVVV